MMTQLVMLHFPILSASVLKDTQSASSSTRYGSLLGPGVSIRQRQGTDLLSEFQPHHMLQSLVRLPAMYSDSSQGSNSRDQL
ncbi:hypothetical protein EJ05DRAFT_59843 [Pseudovirgaria hyperparasitica]|uniref:Uncharacterized protein n=1 Tax=Pseudovirgaria hyperparasitica TaxID=470096 RepID=A0A6A6W5D1_9PEZI|nr:uncharacterized protein EJ05DRAFT_59843 [Pseudovirgaria hyperparasitica]KAF2757244.1 hypothetical protein EJ05DRAFT_59843 [Pseudovirgaria hyperparasitica]